MARRIRNKNLESRAARRKLSPRNSCYFQTIERGLQIGYRRIRNGAGTWWLRHYVGDRKYKIESIGAADDLSDADGHAVLDFWQAQNLAREQMAKRARNAAGIALPFTVDDAMREYFEYLEGEGRTKSAIHDARQRAAAFVSPTLGKCEVASLTVAQLEKWRNALAKTPARIRSRKGEKPRHRAAPVDDNGQRARRASTNRIRSLLFAALNLAYSKDRVATDHWRKMKPFRNVDVARIRYLSIAEAQRLVNSCEPDLRLLVQAALHTGARVGQIARLVASDFNADAGTLRLTSRKGDGSEKVFHCTLTDDGRAFFGRMCAGRKGTERLFFNNARVERGLAQERARLIRDGKSPDGARVDDAGDWRKSETVRPIKEAAARAKIEPLGIHTMRHTWASHAVMAGMPLLVVAKNLGHADTKMVERHYGHLAPSYITEAVRKYSPDFGLGEPTNVTPLRR